ncbi:hypothetical protein C8A05DRAFT_40512 [Staphylotrichum tortipilum]|uniref:Uncharacterized protein n=1 Tax=Staphylotrichum tortipilum TaxID=2831512 RepID=A0AAN6RXN3_9PEZI|nr:hypothetical protein C8A05DRAFT_40512 [Staphylotrichum longicolle]
MAGLIPLMLGSGSRTSFLGPSPSSQPTQKRQSMAGPPISTSPTTLTPFGRPKLAKRLSLPLPVSIPVLPYTKAEWRKTIAEIKRKYFSKRYRACSTTCVEILDNIKDVSQVEPVYLIYLHFYAATSMEICARPLPSTAALRANLLQQARVHFDKASALINTAEESVLRRFRPGSVSSSRGSSCHSPSGSVSSRAWTPDDTRVSTPTESVYSFDDLSPRSPQSPPPKRVKKVSFSLPKEASLHIVAEPIIRPDSPTLGFDFGFFQSGPPQHTLPELPVKFHEIEMPLHRMPEDNILKAPLNTVEEEEDDHDAMNGNSNRNSTLLVSRSVDRCCEHLSSLRSQLALHSTTLDQLLCQQSELSSSSSPKSEAAPAKPADRRSTAEQARALDRQARIERLRRCGWQRKRFDASRYEVLCEAVIAELE